MNDRSVLAELLDLACHPVVEADADSQQKIGLVHRVVGVNGAMHAEPFEGEVVILGEATDSHQGGGHGDLGTLRKLLEFLGSIRRDHASAAVDHRLLGGGDQTEHFLKGDLIGPAHGVVAAQGDALGEDRLGRLVLDILGNIDQHRPRTPTLGDMESLLDDAGDVIDIPDEIAVLHHGKGHPEKVGLLESPAPDHLLRHLTGDCHQGHRVHVGIGNAGDQIRCTGTRGGHADAGLSGHTGIPFGGKSPPLLMTGKDGTDLLRLGQGLMDRHRATTGVGKDIIHPLALQ